MKELGITKGEWGIENKFDHKHDQDIFAINSKFGGEILNEEFISVWTWMIEEEAEANAKLIADAGTTANKCGMLPSELLKQRDQLLIAALDAYNSIGDSDPSVRKTLEEAINNTNTMQGHCNYCGEVDICTGTYPEGCFLENHQNKIKNENS